MNIAIVAHGDPAASSTWSGTPKAIMTAFKAAGHGVIGINASPPTRMLKGFLLVRHRLMYGHTYFRESKSYNLLCSTYLNKQLDELASQGLRPDSIFHMGTKALNHEVDSQSGNSYVFLDYPLCLQAEFRVGGARRDDLLVQEVERRGLENVAKIFVTGEYVMKALVEKYRLSREKIEVVGTGFNAFLRDITRSKQKSYSRKNILFACKIDSGWEYKGGKLLLESFRKVRARLPDATLTIVGSEAIARELQGIEGVSALGYVEESVLADLYANASVFCMPALSEPWGLVYLEALSTATPVVAAARMGAVEIVDHGKNGWLVNPGDVQDLSEVLLLALTDVDSLHSRGRAGQRYVEEKFSWTNVVSAVERVGPPLHEKVESTFERL